MYRKFFNYIFYFPANNFLSFVCGEGLYLQLKYITGANTGEPLWWTKKILKPPAFSKTVRVM